jgi:hypothetical protein
MDNSILDLFNYETILEREYIEYNNEFHSLSGLRRSEAAYAPDHKAEAEVRRLTEIGLDVCQKRSKKMIHHERFIAEITELMIELWCVMVNGKVGRNLYDQPIAPKLYKPRFSKNILTKIPRQLPIPSDALIAFYLFHPDLKQPRHFVSYFDTSTQLWFSAIVMFDGYKNKWTEPRIIRDYGMSYRADEDHQWFTREGFRALSDAKKLDTLIPAVSTAYFKFYGRDEAIRRLAPLKQLEVCRI